MRYDNLKSSFYQRLSKLTSLKYRTAARGRDFRIPLTTSKTINRIALSQTGQRFVLQTVLFYLISLGVIISAIGVVTSRSAVYSVLWLVATMCMTAGLFVLLKAFLVAMILVLVYAGAILVLFLFVTMLLDFRKLSADWEGLKLSPVLAVAAGVLIFLQAFKVIQTVNLPKTAPLHGTAQTIGSLLFGSYVLPFELTSFLLLAAVVSVVVLAKREPKQ